MLWQPAVPQAPPLTEGGGECDQLEPVTGPHALVLNLNKLRPLDAGDAGGGTDVPSDKAVMTWHEDRSASRYQMH